MLANTKQKIPKYNPINSICEALDIKNVKKGSKKEEFEDITEEAYETKSFIIKRKYPNKSIESLKELFSPTNNLLNFALYSIIPNIIPFWRNEFQEVENVQNND